MIPLEEHENEQSFKKETHHVSEDGNPTHLPEHTVHFVQKFQKYVVGA